MAVLRDTSAVFDNPGANSTCDVSITVASGNSNRLLVVIANTDTDTDVDITSVAFTLQGGSANTDAFSYFNFASDVGRRQEVWYFIAPAEGNATIRATFASAVGGSVAAYSLYNVDQTTPLDGFVKGGAGLSLNVTSATDDYCIAEFVDNGATPSYTSGTNDLNVAGNSVFGKTGYANGAATVTFTVTTTGGIRGSCAFNVNAAAADAGTPLFYIKA